MKELKVLYLYPDILELYGDFGNIQVLKYRLEKRGFKSVIDTYSIGDDTPDFCSYDLVFAGGGGGFHRVDRARVPRDERDRAFPGAGGGEDYYPDAG